MVPARTRGDIAPLTGLRFVAAMLVVLHHYPVPGASGTAATMMQAGYFGVTLFFVLSGFVLAYTYAEALSEAPRATLRRFAVARFARIYPVYLAILLYLWIRSAFDGPVVLHALLLQAWHPDARVAFALNGPGWSISVEAFLYACFPLLVIAFGRGGVFESGARMGVVLAGVVAAMIALAVFFEVTGRNVAGLEPGSAHRWLYRSPVARLGDFVLGMLAAAYYARYRAHVGARRRQWALVTLGAIAFIVACMALPSNIGEHDRMKLALLQDVALNVGYRVSDHVQVRVGYQVLAVSTVLRPGQQIDLGVNPTLLPFSPGPVSGPIRPWYRPDGETFWMHGFTLGVAVQF